MCVESQDVSWIRGLCERTHPLNAPASEKIFMALVAYMDDSGSHVGAPNALVAGYWGGLKEWAYFEWKWKKVLAEFGIDKFHAKVFWPRLPPEGRRLKPYTDWDDMRHHSFIDALLKVIESSNITPFAYGVSAEAWENRSDFWKRTFVGPGFGNGKQHDPLFLSFQVAISKTVNYCKSGKRMHFVYDRDAENAGRFLDWFKQFKRETNGDDDRLGDLVFSNSLQAVPLQAADLLAYEAQKWKKKSIAMDNPNATLRIEYQRALCHLKSLQDFWLFDEPRLKTLENILDAAVRESSAETCES